MKVIEKVREFADHIVKKARHVMIDDDAVKRFADDHLKGCEPDWGTEELTASVVIEELIANSVNYCYWCGHHDSRPGGASAGRMYELLNQAQVVSRVTPSIIREFWQLMVGDRFPLLEERWKHLMELDEHAVEAFVYSVTELNLRDAFVTLLSRFPGYVSDVFLKRAQLLFMMLHRRTKCLGEHWIRGLTVPVDYMLPRVLRAHGCLVYDDELSRMVDRQELIPKHSKWEVEIRAATLVACDALSEISGLSTCAVDEVLWGMRKVTDVPFHLTVTTDY